MRKAVHKTKTLTPAESRRMKSLQAQLDAEQADIKDRGRQILDAHDAVVAELLASLRAVRKELGLSLTDLQTRTGIDRAQLSRLLSESGGVGNPTIQTLERLADACGKRVVLSLQDAV